VSKISLLGLFRSTLNAHLAGVGFQIQRLAPKNQIQIALELLRPFELVEKLIRVGPMGDGGYVIPKFNGNVTALISPGCNGEWEFEKEIYKIFEIPSIVIDHDDKKPIDFHDPHLYINAWVGAVNDSTTRNLSRIISENLKPDDYFILQMDIEGMEYETFLSFEENVIKQARVIIVELHYLENLMNPSWLQYTFFPFIKKINATHQIVYLNGNTYCDLIEFAGMKWPRVLEVTAVLRHDIYHFGKAASMQVNLVDNFNKNSVFRNQDLFWFNNPIL
jgi:hypothetical protein